MLLAHSFFTNDVAHYLGRRRQTYPQPHGGAHGFMSLHMCPFSLPKCGVFCPKSHLIQNTVDFY